MPYPTPFRIAALTLVWVMSWTPARGQSSEAPPEWPAITTEHRPWTRWWWMGSSVDPEELTAAMETYREAGLGGLEITPIYGVAGYEDRFIDYLSPEWMARLAHTLEEAERLDLGIDMATGTGWPFGGPWVPAEQASKHVVYETYQLEGGQRLQTPVVHRQEPFVRAVGSQVYELYGGILGDPDEQAEGSVERPLQRPGSEPVEITELIEPISENENLQALALEQVRFPKELPLQALMAYSERGEVIDLTDRVDERGMLDWTAPAGRWTLYAVFQGWHGKMVERAAPGGEGYVIDHFSEEALDGYLDRFDRAFAGRDLSRLRAFFNDSYEVDDARGQADWTPELFEEFEARRGYDLRRHLPALFGEASEENLRVLTDYRETVSDLLLEEFTEAWRAWAHDHDALVRNQAHGSPGNILDLYAASDIPETEGTDLLRIKFASSAAHVTGKRLTSAESATWLDEHFTSSLADVRRAVDRFLLGGVNHIFYHGTNFSPRGEDWPGWLFYAAVHFSPANPFWTDFGAFNAYVARIQSFLQAGAPDNDVLLYFPIHDRYAERGGEMLRHFDGGDEGFEHTTFHRDAELMQRRGYAFDFISDRQLQGVAAADGALRAGGVSYGTVVVPESRFLPLETFERLADLAEEGATIILHGGVPADVPGLGDLEARREALQRLLGRLDFEDAGAAGIREAQLGEGRFLLGDDLEELLSHAGVRREALVDEGLQFVRRAGTDGTTYFLANWSEEEVDGWIPLSVEAASAALFDPMAGTSGMAPLRASEAGGVEAYVQLAPGTSRILQVYPRERAGRPYPYYRAAGAPQEVVGPWQVDFLEGGPELPAAVEAAELGSWTRLGGEEVKRFSGTARYAVSFSRPQGAADGWVLDLGRVGESARVRLNGEELGTLIGPDYRIPIEASRFEDSNTLEIEVSNLMANRIAYLDRQSVPWKKFYNVNFPARRGENRNELGLFDASAWEPVPSGLMGPVTLTPLDFFSPSESE